MVSVAARGRVGLIIPDPAGCRVADGPTPSDGAESIAHQMRRAADGSSRSGGWTGLPEESTGNDDDGRQRTDATDKPTVECGTAGAASSSLVIGGPESVQPGTQLA